MGEMLRNLWEYRPAAEGSNILKVECDRCGSDGGGGAGERSKVDGAWVQRHPHPNPNPQPETGNQLLLQLKMLQNKLKSQLHSMMLQKLFDKNIKGEEASDPDSFNEHLNSILIQKCSIDMLLQSAQQCSAWQPADLHKNQSLPYPSPINTCHPTAPRAPNPS